MLSGGMISPPFLQKTFALSSVVPSGVIITPTRPGAPFTNARITCWYAA